MEMKLRCFILLLCALWVTNVESHNTFLYLRFDASTDKTFSIKTKIKDIINLSDETLLFYDNEFFSGEDILALVEDKYFLSNLSIYEPSKEQTLLNNKLENLLEERVSVSEQGLKLEGLQDAEWNIVFLLSEDTTFGELLKWIQICGLNSRNIDVSFLLYDRNSQIYEVDMKDLIENNEIELLNF